YLWHLLVNSSSLPAERFPPAALPIVPSPRSPPPNGAWHRHGQFALPYQNGRRGLGRWPGAAGEPRAEPPLRPLLFEAEPSFADTPRAGVRPRAGRATLPRALFPFLREPAEAGPGLPNAVAGDADSDA